MNKIPTEQQVERLWKWCGFKRLPQGKAGYHWEQCAKVMNWMPPGSTETYHSMANLPIIDLENLFQWAVPKLPAYDGIEFWESTDGWVCHIVLDHAGTNETGIDKNPALALFWAIYKVFHDVNKLERSL